MGPGEILTPEWRPREARVLDEVRAEFRCPEGAEGATAHEWRSLLAQAHAALHGPAGVEDLVVLRHRIGLALRGEPT